MPAKNKSSSKKKIVLIVFSVLFLFAFGFVLALVLSDEILPFLNKKIIIPKVRVVDSEVPLPIIGKISGYIQSELVDLDKDGVEEAVVIYHDDGGATKIYRTYFAVFKLEDSRWVKLVDKELEGFSIWDETETAEEVGERLTSFELVELTGSDPQEVFIKTRSEGSGSFMGIFVYGLIKEKEEEEKVDLLFLEGPVPKGQAGIEKDKLWLIAPVYQEGDANCCPSSWVKTWWEWKENEFIQASEFTHADFDRVDSTGYSVEQKIQSGFIEGSLSYPSEGIPSDMKICAESVVTGKVYCTDKQLEHKKYTYGVGYKLEVPEGDYHLYASTKMLKDYQAYYTDYVICGLVVECNSHEKIVVNVVKKKTSLNIDPGDWYQ